MFTDPHGLSAADIDIGSVSGDGVLSLMVSEISSDTFPAIRGSTMLKSGDFEGGCGGVSVGSPSSTQRLIPSFSNAVSGEYRLSLGGGLLTSCIDLDASAQDLEQSLRTTLNREDTDVRGSPDSYYTVYFKGEYSTGEWPLIRGKLEHMNEFGDDSNCSPFSGGSELPNMVTMPVTWENPCLKGSPGGQVIVVHRGDSSEPVDGSAGVWYRGTNIGSFEFSDTPASIEQTLKEGGLNSKVLAYSLSGTTTGIAWVVTSDESSDTDELVLSDRFTDATLEVCDVVIVNTVAAEPGMTGAFRLRIGNEETEEINVMASAGRMRSVLEELEEIESATVLSPATGHVELAFDISLSSGSTTALIQGRDMTDSIATGDIITLESSASMDPVSVISLVFDGSDSVVILDEAAPSNGDYSGTVGPSFESRKYSGFDFVMSSVATVQSVTGSLELGLGELSNGITISMGDTLLIGGSAIDVESVLTDSNGDVFVTMDEAPLEGFSIGLTVYLPVMTAYHTAELGSNVDVGTCLWVLNEAGDFDEVTVTALGPETGMLSISASDDTPFSADYQRAKVFGAANGREWTIAIKSRTVDLSTLTAIPSLDFSGLDASIRIQHPRGRDPMSFILGSPPEIRTVALRSFEGVDTTGATWVASVGTEDTAALAWDATATEVTTALEALPNIASVQVERVGDGSSPEHFYGYVHTITFTGTNVLQIPSLVVDTSGLPSGATVWVNVLQSGADIQQASVYGEGYLSLRENTSYALRARAGSESKGWGPLSDALMITTPVSGVIPYAPTAVAVGSTPSLTEGSLSLVWQPSLETGGKVIDGYVVEWGTGINLTAGASFSDYVDIVHEIQIITVNFRSIVSERGGTFTLSWGGRTTANLPWTTTAIAMETAIHGISGVDELGINPVSVTRSALKNGYRWKITFQARRGNLGLINADGSLLTGDAPSIEVEKHTTGSADIHPGSYTLEQQSVTVVGNAPITGTFTLSFHGQNTDAISTTESADDFKQKLQALSSLHIVDVTREIVTAHGHVTWRIKMSWLENQIAAGAGDISLLRLEDSSGLVGNGAGVEIFEMVKGTLPLTYSLSSLDLGKEYFARVAAHNTIGISPFSYVSSGTPSSQPGPPVDLRLSIESGTSLRANWFPPQDSGGSEVTSYLVEWWKENEPGISEIQMITTAADRGEFEVQIVSLRSDANNLGGTYTLSFPGEVETTNPIAFDSPPVGLGSVKEALEGLSSVGEVDVSQDFSFSVIPSLLIDVRDGNNVVTLASDSPLNPLQAGLSYNDLIVLGTGFRARVKAVTTGSISLGTEADTDTDLNFSGGDADSVHIERWSFGYEYAITFTSFNGNVPLLLAEPSNGWTGKNPSISVNEVHRGSFATGGVFRASFLGESTAELHHDASAEVVREALVGLKGLSDVSVERMVNGNGYTWLVTFVSNHGDQEPLKVSETGLTGTNGRVTVTTGNNGELPGGYGSAVALNSSSGTDPSYTITDLEQGVTYNVIVRAGNGEGYGISTSASAHAPLEAPGLSDDVELIAMSNSMLKVVWGPPESTGGAFVSRYRLEWDLDANFSNIGTSGFYYEFVIDDSTLPESGKYYYNIIVASSSSWRPRFARIRAYNGFSWGEWAYTVPVSVTPAQGVPGNVQNPSLKVLSGVEIMVSWEMPSSELAEYGGDGGSPIVDYVVEWDTSPSFNSPPHRATIPMPGDLEYVIGSRNMFTGEEEGELEEGVEYYVRVAASNTIGYGTWVPASPASVTTMNQTPEMPHITGASPVDPTTLRVEWEPPLRDGGSALESFRVEWDIDHSGFSHINGSGKAGGWEDVPLVKEVLVTAVTADTVQEEQWLVGTTEVTNEVQRVSTDAAGVDEVQLISTTAKAVQPAIQTITTYAADYNERQTISLDALEVNEIQWIETTSDEIVEVQNLYVAARRVSEVSEFTLVLTGDATDGTGDSLVTLAASEVTFQLTLDTSAMRWAATQSQEVTSNVLSFNDASGVQNALGGLANVDLINVDYDRQITTTDAVSGVVELTYTITFAGDGIRGDVPDGAFFVSSCSDAGSGSLSLSCPPAMTTITEGNEVTGSFHVEYNCEANVEDIGTIQRLSSGIDSSVIMLENNAFTSLIEPGDTIRVYLDEVLMPWSYWKVIDVSIPSGEITLSSPFTGLDDTSYLAQAGDFYSDPEATNGFGVSSACMVSDPEASVAGIDCASSASALADSIMGLATVAEMTSANDDCV